MPITCEQCWDAQAMYRCPHCRRHLCADCSTDPNRKCMKRSGHTWETYYQQSLNLNTV